jgi:predicted membrane protein
MEQHHTTWQTNVQFGKQAQGMTPGRLIAGVAVIAIGTAFLFDQFDIIDFGQTIGTWWPVVLMVIGLVQLTTRSANNWFGSTLLFAAGALLLASNLDFLPGGFWSTFWPVVIILIGISILIGAKKKSQLWGSGKSLDSSDVNIGSAEDATLHDDFIRRTAVFSGLDLESASNAFQGGSLSAVFAGIELDLRNAQPASEKMLMDVSAIMGGIEIRVPSTWRVHTTGTPVLGGIENRTIGRLAEVGTDTPLLIVRCTAILGGIEIRH